MTYNIRQFQPDDVDPFLELFETVFGERKSRGWFDWKYVENPYLEDYPILVADNDGELIGVRGLIGMDFWYRGSRLLTLPLADSMVHPDHRRQGLFTRLNKRMLEKYEGSNARLIHNYPNEKSKPTYEKLGWQVAGKLRASYRFQNPGSLLASNLESSIVEAAKPYLSLIAGGAMRANRRLATVSEVGTVERHESLPVEKLAALHDQHRPETAHGIRDKEWYEWRLANPEWNYQTYLGRRDGELVSAVVTVQDGKKTKVVESLPLKGTSADTGVLAAILRAVIEDHSNTDIIIVPTDAIPEAVLSAFGFINDEAPFLNRLVRIRTRTVYPLGDDWSINGFPVNDQQNWSTTFLDIDTY